MTRGRSSRFGLASTQWSPGPAALFNEPAEYQPQRGSSANFD